MFLINNRYVKIYNFTNNNMVMKRLYGYAKRFFTFIYYHLNECNVQNTRMKCDFTRHSPQYSPKPVHSYWAIESATIAYWHFHHRHQLPRSTECLPSQRSSCCHRFPFGFVPHLHRCCLVPVPGRIQPLTPNPALRKLPAMEIDG